MTDSPPFNCYGQSGDTPLWLQTGMETLEKAAAPSITRLVAENVEMEKEKVRREMKRYVLVGTASLGAFMLLLAIFVVAGRR